MHSKHGNNFAGPGPAVTSLWRSFHQGFDGRGVFMKVGSYQATTAVPALFDDPSIDLRGLVISDCDDLPLALLAVKGTDAMIVLDVYPKEVWTVMRAADIDGLAAAVAVADRHLGSVDEVVL